MLAGGEEDGPTPRVGPGELAPDRDRAQGAGGDGGAPGAGLAVQAVGVDASPEAQVLRLATLTRDAGLDGVVCSAREASVLRQAFGHGFCLVTPGVRPVGGARDDQQRVMTPGDAIRAGADYLVVGRPVTKSDNPEGVLLTLESEISSVLAD